LFGYFRTGQEDSVECGGGCGGDYARGPGRASERPGGEVTDEILDEFRKAMAVVTVEEFGWRSAAWALEKAKPLPKHCSEVACHYMLGLSWFVPSSSFCECVTH